MVQGDLLIQLENTRSITILQRALLGLPNLRERIHRLLGACIRRMTEARCVTKLMGTAPVVNEYTPLELRQ